MTSTNRPTTARFEAGARVRYLRGGLGEGTILRWATRTGGDWLVQWDDQDEPLEAFEANMELVEGR